MTGGIRGMVVAGTVAACALGATGALAQSGQRDPSPPDPQVRTTTPIRHVVIIFDENISFDHYFGTYPHAANPPGEPQFHAAPGTPTVNGPVLGSASGAARWRLLIRAPPRISLG